MNLGLCMQPYFGLDPMSNSSEMQYEDDKYGWDWEDPISGIGTFNTDLCEKCNYFYKLQI